MFKVRELILRNQKRIKRLFSDFLYKTMAGIISTGTQQLVVLPLLAKFFSAEMYGVILTIRGVYNAIYIGFGNSLANVRQITYTDYSKKGIVGDYNLLAWIFAGISAVLLVVTCFFVGNVTIFEMMLLIPSVFVATLNAYYLVHYNLVLDFKKLLFNSIISSSGAILGILLVKYTMLWPLPLLFSGIFSLMNLFFTTPRIREPFRQTELMFKTLSKYAILLAVTLVAQSLLYLDRLIVYPIIGGEAVATYSTAAFFGKSVAVIISPLSSVLLGYYCQDTFKMSLKYFWSGNIIVLVLSALFMLISIIMAPWLTGLLFPTLIDMANPYIFISNLAAILCFAGNVAQSAVLKFANIFWQIVIQVCYAAIYVILGVLVMPKYGLWGFCYVVLFANVVRLILLYTIGHYSIMFRVNIKS